MRNYGPKKITQKHNQVMGGVKLLMAEQGDDDIAAVEARFNAAIDKLAGQGPVWRPKG
jgi:hypothetical protein